MHRKRAVFKTMNQIRIEDINERIKYDVKGFIKECEDVYEKRIYDAAERIKSYADKRPIILLSGPSGAGKTTTALKLEELLDHEGIETHTISMDNYFIPLKDEIGIDLEAPSRLDIPLLQEHLIRLAEGKEIDVPIFRFKSQIRAGCKRIKRKKGELVVIEGIHALNPDVTGYKTDFTHSIYLSPDTRISYKDKTLRRADIRLLRRLTRDVNFRGRSFEHTLSQCEKVEEGAKKYIIPFKDRADIQIDTLIPYEIGVYRKFDLKGLLDIPAQSKSKAHADNLYMALKNAESVEENLIPKNSLVREFIGGSAFEY